jgi:hypothetical protein
MYSAITIETQRDGPYEIAPGGFAAEPAGGEQGHQSHAQEEGQADQLVQSRGNLS